MSKQTGTPPAQAQRRGTGPPAHGSNQGAKSRSRRTSRTSTGGPCLGARGKQAQLAQANGSKFNLLLMLVAQMSTYPRVIATHYCSWGSRNFKLTHGALTAFEDLGVVAVAVPRRARRCFSARWRRPPTRHRNCGCLPCQSARGILALPYPRYAEPHLQAPRPWATVHHAPCSLRLDWCNVLSGT